MNSSPLFARPGQWSEQRITLRTMETSLCNVSAGRNETDMIVDTILATKSKSLDNPLLATSINSGSLSGERDWKKELRK